MPRIGSSSGGAEAPGRGQDVSADLSGSPVNAMPCAGGRKATETLRWNAMGACAELTRAGGQQGAKHGNAENYWGPNLEIGPTTARAGWEQLVPSAYRPDHHSRIPAVRSTSGTPENSQNVKKVCRCTATLSLFGRKGSRVCVSFRIWLLIRIPSCREDAGTGERAPR